jgi:hypothetical protein
MRKIIFMLFGIALSFVLILSPAFSAETKTVQIRKQPEIQQVKPKKPVKIRMKRSADGKYTWDLTGDDVDEIVKADKRLKKLLNIE